MRIQHLCKWPDGSTDNLVAEYKSGQSLFSLAAKYSCSPMTVSKTLRRAGANIRLIRHHIDSRYFNVIDSAEKAYWFGFLVADGYAKRHNNNYHFVLKLKESDEPHLLKLRKALNSTHPLKKKKKTGKFGTFSHVIFEFNCKELVNDVNNIGLYTFRELGSPPKIPPQFDNHFFRGFFDGDGWIGFNEKGRSGRWPRAAWGMCGEKVVLEYFLKLLTKNCGIIANTLQYKSSIYSVQYAGCKQVSHICDWLYKDSHESIRLTRKHDKYIKLKEHFQ